MRKFVGGVVLIAGGVFLLRGGTPDDLIAMVADVLSQLVAFGAELGTKVTAK